MARAPCKALLGTAIVALVLIGTANTGSLPSWYSCSCRGSAAPNASDCLCPSTTPPAGLPPSQVPQFILFTYDDAVTPAVEAALRSILDGRSSADGCTAAATLFTLSRGTDCELLRGLHRDGYEVADHSLSHQKMNGWTRGQVEAEVVGGRASLASKCGIPERDIVGWRQPYLMASPPVRQVLLQEGFLYDSTLLDDPLEGGLSRGMGQRMWPYGMQDGPLCHAKWHRYQECAQGEHYPGLFQMPVWDMSATGLFSSDPADRGGRSVLQVLREAFDSAYTGNRAPLPIYVHSSFFTPEGVAAMQQFADYALSLPHVYFVTMRQALGWMRAPVPAEQVTPASLGCGNAGGASGPEDQSAAAAAAAAAPGGGVPQGGTTGAAGAAGTAVASAGASAGAAPAFPGAAAVVQQVQEQEQSPTLPGSTDAAAAAATGAAVTAAAGAAAVQAGQAGQAAAQGSPGSGAAGDGAAYATQAEGVAAQEPPQQEPQQLPEGGADGGASSSNLAAIVGGAIGGALAALATLALAAMAARRRQRRATAAAALTASSVQRSAYATHLYATHMQRMQPGGGVSAHVSLGGGANAVVAKGLAAALRDVELAEVIEQSGTPGSGSARRRVTTEFNS